MAESSPYYVGVAQALSYDSNLYRLSSDQATPSTVKKRSDLISTTSLVGGIDQPIGRQRLYGNVALRANRFSSNDSLNNEGYSLNLALDWQTINRLSGTVSVAANRNLRRFDPNEASASQLQRNIESSNSAEAVVRLGVVTRLTTEAGLNWRQTRYSAASYTGAESNQSGGMIGLRYRPGGATVFGVGVRSSQTRYPSSNVTVKRSNVDLTANWTPSSLSSVFGRLSYGRTDTNVATISDFTGITGELRGVWQVSGKVRLNARLQRDTGQETDFQGLADAVIVSNDLSRTTATAHLGADYALSAKINISTGVTVAQRDLTNSRFILLRGTDISSGDDTTTTFSLGAKWVPTRSIQLGCDLSSERRSASNTLSRPYSNNGVSCFGQLTFQ